MTVDEILKAIDEIDIYEYDYQVIEKLLASGNNKLFTKILEEVINGELYWSDFDEYLSNTEYPNLIMSNLLNQEKLEKKLKLLIDFRKNTNSSYVYNDDNSLFLTGASEDNTFYNNEISKLKENMIYRILNITPEDNEISIALKNALYNAIRNAEIYRNNDSDYEFIDGSIVDENGNNYDYLDYNDLLLFLYNQIIPMNYDNQILDEFDKDYMKENNLTESQMKQFKSLSILLRRHLSE